MKDSPVLYISVCTRGTLDQWLWSQTAARGANRVLGLGALPGTGEIALEVRISPAYFKPVIATLFAMTILAQTIRRTKR